MSPWRKTRGTQNLLGMLAEGMSDPVQVGGLTRVESLEAMIGLWLGRSIAGSAE